MPLFLFMSGAALPFSIRKYNNATSAYIRILKRVFLLFVLGMVVQGNLLGLEISKLHFYSNTLQSIGVGYLFSAVIFLNFKLKGRIIAAAICFIVCWALMSFCGDYLPDGNAAEKIDKFVMGRWRDGVHWKDGQWFFSSGYHYTWILSSMNFVITVILGSFAGWIMMGENKIKNFKRLMIFAIALICGGLLMSFQMPIIKKIWSSSMTLYSGGLCMLAMAIFYYVIDCKSRWQWLGWLKIYGMNCIFAYMVSMVVNFRSIPQSLLYGLKQYVGDFYLLIINVSQYSIIFFILYIMHKRKIFLKV